MKKNKIVTNSKYVKKGDIFICNNKNIANRDEYIKDALSKKAKKIVCKNTLIQDKSIMKVDNINQYLLDIALKYYQVDLNNIKLIGVTGTDGKTTVANLIKDIMSNFIRTSYLGTIGFKVDKYHENTNNTTPKLEDIIKYIKKAIDKKASVLAMETSSEGLFYDRCYGLNFEIGILTNITKDHLNTHKNIKNYIKSKSILFKQVTGFAILNKDDKYFKTIKKNCNCSVITYGMKKDCDFYFYNVKCFDNHTTFNLKYSDNDFQIHSPLLAKYNVYNLVSAIASAVCMGININDVISCIPSLKPIDGRLSLIDCNQNYSIVVDYAHTINATKETLKFFNKIKKNRLITILGCAGGRDKTKRKDVGYLASKYSDYVIYTEDDPRDENVNNIIIDMLKKVHTNNYEIVLDRKEAVVRALSVANKNDTVLFLGKGNDSYMASNTGYIHYLDEEEIRNYFKKNRH